jgi:hypothetical protein
MLRKIIFAVCLAVVVAAATPLTAQEPAPSPDELILRPGDTITWTPSSPHRLRFGGTVTHSGAPLTLTPFSDVQKVLEINPPLTADSTGVALGGTGAVVNATVKSDAATSGVAEFFFTCGFPAHTGLMVTVPFTVQARNGQPQRNVQIVSANPPRWILKDSPDKKLTRP